MRDNLVSIRCAVAFGAFMLLALASSANAKEVYTGTVIGVGGPLGGVSRPLTLEIDSYTSKAESSRAVAVLAEDGQDRLLKELEGKRLGYFSLGGQLGRDLNFVQKIIRSVTTSCSSMLTARARAHLFPQPEFTLTRRTATLMLKTSASIPPVWSALNCAGRRPGTRRRNRCRHFILLWFTFRSHWCR